MIEDACTFCSTLVDRIVTGYPAAEIEEIRQELGYEDNFLVTVEYFYLFVIEGPAWLADELKLEEAGLNILLVEDITPYKQRKVGVLNGGHTTMVPVALLCANRWKTRMSRASCSKPSTRKSFRRCRCHAKSSNHSPETFCVVFAIPISITAWIPLHSTAGVNMRPVSCPSFYDIMS